MTLCYVSFNRTARWQIYATLLSNLMKDLWNFPNIMFTYHQLTRYIHFFYSWSVFDLISFWYKIIYISYIALSYIILKRMFLLSTLEYDPTIISGNGVRNSFNSYQMYNITRSTLINNKNLTYHSIVWRYAKCIHFQSEFYLLWR